MSRSFILKKIQDGKPKDMPALPEILFDEDSNIDLLSKFSKQLEENKATVLTLREGESIRKIIDNRFGSVRTWSQLPDVATTQNISAGDHPHMLDDLELAVLEGKLGVADNGAIWVSEINPRIIPFITLQLVIVIDRQNIVRHMHHAYDQINPNSLSFGVFISGPSKTADIEQALVVGAQGALGLTVIIKK